MKLSQAMQIGISKSTSHTGSYITVNENDEICACALGASLLVISSSLQLQNMSEDEIDAMIGQAFPEIYAQVGGGSEFKSLGREIAKRNDAGVDRSEIAKWVESMGY